MIELEVIRQSTSNCQLCKLHTTRTNVVFGDISSNSKWILLGEAPGQQEDEQGRPFVGRSGQLLDKLLLEIGWSRSRVHVFNTTMCRPPENRKPEVDELKSCTPFLIQKFEAIKPVVITPLGTTATSFILGNQKFSISKIRGNKFTAFGATIIPTFHPSYALRGYNTQAIADMKADLSLAMAEVIINESV